MNILIYDCEIIKCIPPKEGERDPSLRYCRGWRDFEGMGISLIGAWSSANGLSIYTAQTFHLFRLIDPVTGGILKLREPEDVV